MKRQLVIVSCLLSVWTGLILVATCRETPRDAEWHCFVPRDVGSPLEDPNGCPCACPALGWVSCRIVTNWIVYGYTNPYEIAREKYGVSGDVLNLVSEIVVTENDDVSEKILDELFDYGRFVDLGAEVRADCKYPAGQKYDPAGWRCFVGRSDSVDRENEEVLQ